MSAVRQQEDVITQQKRLLEEANEKQKQSKSYIPPLESKTSALKSNILQKSASQIAQIKPEVQLNTLSQCEIKSQPTSPTAKNFSPEEKIPLKFDALKTPSYFLAKTATLEKLVQSPSLR